MSKPFTQNRRDFLKETAAAAALVPALSGGLTYAAEETLGRFYIQPYLQNPTADGMTICFAAIDATEVNVRFGRSKDALKETARMESAPIANNTWRVWKARLAKLEAGKDYYYQVTYREGEEAKSSAVYHFSPFDPQAEELRAVVYNDVHDRIATAEALVRHVQSDDFRFSILLGDMWNDPSTRDNARRTFENLAAYVRLFDGSNKPMLFVRGNHDVRGGFASQLSHLFDLPLNDPTAGFADQNAYHDFRCGPVWFIAPDSGEDESKQMDLYQPYRERQAKWLKQTLAESPHRVAPWRILATHIPLYYRGYWDAAHSRALWEETLTAGKIDLSIAGHIHAYESIPAGKEIVHTRDKGKPTETTLRHTPPFPTIICGGPSLKEATVTFLTATADQLSIRALNVEGKEVVTLALSKGT